MCARSVVTASLRTGEATTMVIVGAFCGPRVNESMARISGGRGEQNTTRHDEHHQRNKKVVEQKAK
jgi:hypothetical protein